MVFGESIVNQKFTEAFAVLLNQIGGRIELPLSALEDGHKYGVLMEPIKIDGVQYFRFWADRKSSELQ